MLCLHCGLNIPVNNFSIMFGQSKATASLVITNTLKSLKCFALTQGHCKLRWVSYKPKISCFVGMYTTTMPPHSPLNVCYFFVCLSWYIILSIYSLTLLYMTKSLYLLFRGFLEDNFVCLYFGFKIPDNNFSYILGQRQHLRNINNYCSLLKHLAQDTTNSQIQETCI